LVSKRDLFQKHLHDVVLKWYGVKMLLVKYEHKILPVYTLF